MLCPGHFDGVVPESLAEVFEDGRNTGLHGCDITGDEERSAEAVEVSDFHVSGLGGDIGGDDDAVGRDDGEEAERVLRLLIKTQADADIALGAGDDVRKGDLLAGNVFLDDALLGHVR